MKRVSNKKNRVNDKLLTFLLAGFIALSAILLCAYLPLETLSSMDSYSYNAHLPSELTLQNNHISLADEILGGLLRGTTDYDPDDPNGGYSGGEVPISDFAFPFIFITLLFYAVIKQPFKFLMK